MTKFIHVCYPRKDIKLKGVMEVSVPIQVALAHATHRSNISVESLAPWGPSCLGRAEMKCTRVWWRRGNPWSWPLSEVLVLALSDPMFSSFSGLCSTPQLPRGSNGLKLYFLGGELSAAQVWPSTSFSWKAGCVTCPVSHAFQQEDHLAG